MSEACAVTVASDMVVSTRMTGTFGNFDTEIPVDTGDEIGTLARSFSQMGTELKSSRLLLEQLEGVERGLGRFARAEAGFLACEKDCPDDYCVKTYLQASREFSAKPPPPEWDGRIVMETK